MKPNSILSVLFVIFICGLFTSNSSCRLPTNDLTPEEMDIVDTMYNATITDYRKELDSLCGVGREQKILGQADSLVELQLKEINKLISRE